jgi:hypothetical protein
MKRTDMPLAVRGLNSYRYAGRFGWVMIGAFDDGDALVQAARSVRPDAPTRDRLERWDGTRYVAVSS